MNNIIYIDGLIGSSINENGGGGVRLDKDGYVSTQKIERLRNAIVSTIETWNKQKTFCKPIVSIKYIRVVPKSLRMSELFKTKGESIERTIVGASFCSSENVTKHVIVYCLSIVALESGLKKLNLLELIVSNFFNGRINKREFSILANTKYKPTEDDSAYRDRQVQNIEASGMSESSFLSLVQDVFYIEDIYIDTNPDIATTSEMLVSFYDVGLNRDELLEKLNLSRSTPAIGNKKDGYAYSLSPDQIKAILNQYPYLVSMGSLSNLNSIPVISGSQIPDLMPDIPDPVGEPVVGVIDGPFDTSAYFSKWVEYNNEYDSSDKRHGTAVSSLIVDGPNLNPDLDDGCGRFRVKHFSVMTEEGNINQFDLYHQIESIIAGNTNIKVWNISLGTIQEIQKNAISPMAALLDRLQSEKDVIFVISGTNNDDPNLHQPYIGAPADSINSIVVNAVTKNGKVPEYARRGPVLSFYLCPDLCAIGGDPENFIIACSGKILSSVYGTSYAACWVTRKLAYLIYYLNCTREEAKAILIDAAYGWNPSHPSDWEVKGCGILPHHIDSIITTSNDEVKILVKGRCEKYRTYSFDLNTPLDSNGKFPYWTKATLCYFPKCSRKQGVDYAQTEIDLHFGRLSGDLKLNPIDDNIQDSEGKVNLPEDVARTEFRKWDCVKHICEKIKDTSRPKKVLFRQKKESAAGQPWGFYLLKKKRSAKFDDNPNFAMVITFKSMDRKNRYDEFLKTMRYIGWYAQPLEPRVMHEIYNVSQEDVEFDT